MEEAQRLADRVAVMAGGRLIAVAAPDELGGEQVALVTFRLPEGVDPGELFPLMFLLIFGSLNGDAMVAGASGGEVRFVQFYAPSIGIFGLTLACYTNVIFGLAAARDERLLKRVRGTPLPMPVYLGSWLTCGHARPRRRVAGRARARGGDARPSATPTRPARGRSSRCSR